MRRRSCKKWFWIVDENFEVVDTKYSYSAAEKAVRKLIIEEIEECDAYYIMEAIYRISKGKNPPPTVDKLS